MVAALVGGLAKRIGDLGSRKKLFLWRSAYAVALSLLQHTVRYAEFSLWRFKNFWRE